MGYKYEVSKKVYDAIVIAYGASQSAPVFQIRAKTYPGKKQILMYYPGISPKIIMDEEVYDLCADLGADSLNALASVLGHELAHHYEKHDWCSSFSYLLDEKQALKQKLSKITKEEKLRIEAEADYYGGFYGYVAGFSTFDISAKLLDKIYAFYKLPDKLNGYPTKNERKQIALKSLKELEQYQAVFSAGESMVCLKEYQMASSCFEYLADKFPSREMFGNAGLLKVLSAMDYIDEKSMPFALPLEIDAGTRLKSGAVRGVGLSVEEKGKREKQLLEEAIKFFNKAIYIEPGYINAIVNRGCAYVLLNNPDMAVGICNDLLKSVKNKLNAPDLAKLYSLRAIANYNKGEKEKAAEDFNMADIQGTNTINIYNKIVFKELNKGVLDNFIDFVASYFNTPTTSSFGPEKLINPSFEKIGVETSMRLNIDKGKFLEIPGTNTFSITFLTNENTNGLRINGERVYKILFASRAYHGKTSQGIGIYDSIEKIKMKYGEPTYSVNEVGGIYHIYRKSRIVFFVSKENRLLKWFTYY